jgi:nucleoside-diphosphate-sugar epimerase
VKVLVAGDRGYIGAVLVPMLQAAGHQVSGLDAGLYERCDFLGGPIPIGTLRRDIRDVTAADLAGLDAVVCLAALSNDPLGALNVQATHGINHIGTLRLAEAAKAAGVTRFVFASSCSLYGAAGSAPVAEDAPLNPVTPYGETKSLAEQGLSLLADDTFSPTYMRNATAYGPSPRLRLDIVVNNLSAVALTTGQVRLESDGTAWRPLVHVADISRACLAMLTAPRELIHDQAFNVGRGKANLRIREVAEMVAAAVPGSTLAFAPGAGTDARNYRVDFSKLEDTFPNLRLSETVAGGAAALVAAYTEHGLTAADFAGSRYFRLRRIQELQAQHVLDDLLRRLPRSESPLAEPPAQRTADSVGSIETADAAAVIA